jgi:homopolymeric O-antigen transport system permease protein
MTLSAEPWVIEPRRAGVVARVVELWRRRSLVGYFGMRMLHRQTAKSWLGPAWIVVRPLVPVVLGTLVFGGLLRAPSHGVPYFLFFLIGTLVWSLFESGAIAATRSLEMNRRIVTRIYFPRLVLPVAGMLPALVEAGVYAILAVLAVVYYRVATGRLYAEPSMRLAVAALALAAVAACALALGLITAVLQARSRDTRHALRYVMRFWFFATPVIYPMDTAGRWQWLLSLNPLAPLVEAFRWSILGVGHPDLGHFVLALGMVTAGMIGALVFFDRAEAHAIDGI